MIEIGRLCVKIAGRDAGMKCVIVDVLDDKFVLIDGETRRRKCNVIHLEPLKSSIKIKKNASHADVKGEFEKLGLKARETKPKEKKEKQVKQRGKKKAQAKETKKDSKKKGKSEKPKKKATEKKEESLEEKAGLNEDEPKKKPVKK